MRVLLLASFLGSQSLSASDSAHVDRCSDALSAQWRTAIAGHAVDASKHVPVLQIMVPQSATKTLYDDVIRDLSRAFPSFRLNPGSGIMMGCCSWPIYGAISFDDLARLSAANFTPLCEIGKAATNVGVRIEYREPYEAGVGTDAYFRISY